MKIELKHPGDVTQSQAPRPGLEPKIFSQNHGVTEDVARRIISISLSGDQAHAIAELMR